MTSLLAALAWWGVLLCLAYLVTMAVLFAVLYALGVRDNRRRARESRIADTATLRASPFTIPVSIVAPAYNEEACVVAAVRSLLALDYPEFEVIVVNDGSTDGTLDVLRETFGLEAAGASCRRVLPSAEVRQIYRAAAEPRLIVVDKRNGGKADALNCGLNVARYRYVCCVDGDTVYHRDALLRGMRLAVQDPATVVGVTSHVEVSSRPEIAAAAGGGLHADRDPLVIYQLFDYLRAFVGARVAWSRGNYMLCAVGAFAIWRRDVLLDLGGFSPRFTCEDIELTFRVHEHFRRTGTPYRIVALPDPVGVTEGPASIRALVSQRARWQRVITETVWHYRRMLCNPRYGAVGWVGMPYYVLGEVCAPVVQVLALLLVPVAAAAGVLRWEESVRLAGLIALAGGLLTAGAIFVQERNVRLYPPRTLAYMLLLAPLELFLYRPIMIYAQSKGLIDVLRGDRGWHKFARNDRASAPTRRLRPAR